MPQPEVMFTSSCGCNPCYVQLGAGWFETVAKELSTGAYSTHAADSFFQQRHDRTTAANDDREWAARAVLVDMEPKASTSAFWQLLGPARQAFENRQACVLGAVNRQQMLQG